MSVRDIRIGDEVCTVLPLHVCFGEVGIVEHVNHSYPWPFWVRFPCGMPDSFTGEELRLSINGGICDCIEGIS